MKLQRRVGSSGHRISRGQKRTSYFSHTASGQIHRQDSMRLGDLNLSQHLFSSKTLLNAISPANFSTTGSQLHLKTPKADTIPKGAVLVMTPEDTTDTPQKQDATIQEQLYEIEKHVSPGRGIVYEVFNSPLRPPPTKTIIKRMILEEDPRSVVLQEKKLKKILDTSKHSSDRKSSIDSELQRALPAPAVPQEKKVEEQPILEMDELPSLDLPSEMQSSSFHKIKLQRNLFGGQLKELYYGRAASIDILDSSSTVGTRQAVNSPKYRKAVPQDQYYSPHYKSEAEQIYGAWRAKPSSRPPISQHRLCTMSIEEFTHKYELYPFYYRPRYTIGLPTQMPVSGADFAVLRSSFHIFNGQLKLALSLLQAAFFSEMGAENFGVLYNLGLVQLLYNNLAQACALFAKLYQNDIHRTNLYLAWNYAIVLLHLGQFVDAQRVIQNILHYSRIKAELDGLEDGDSKIPREVAFFRLMAQYVNLRVESMSEAERVLMDQRLSKGVDSPIIEEKAGLEDASITANIQGQRTPPPKTPINNNLIKTVTSAGTLSSVRTPKVMNRGGGMVSSSRRLFSQSGKSSQEILASTRRVNIDSQTDLSHYYSNPMAQEDLFSGSGADPHTPFKVLRFDQFRKKTKRKNLRIPLESAKERAAAGTLNKTMILGPEGLFTDDSQISFENRTQSGFKETKRMKPRLLSEGRKRFLDKQKHQQQRMEEFQTLIGEFSALFGLDKKHQDEDTLSGVSIGLSQTSLMKTQNQMSRSGSPALQSRPMTRQGNDSLMPQQIKDSIGITSSIQKSGILTDTNDMSERVPVQEESVRQEENQQHFIKLLPREPGELLTYSELLQNQRQDCRDMLQKKTYELQTLAKQYYHTMYTKSDPLTEEYNNLLNMLKEAGHVISPWGDRRGKTPLESVYSQRSQHKRQKLRADSKQAIAERLGHILNIEKSYHFPQSLDTPADLSTPSIRVRHARVSSADDQEKWIIMKELDINEEEYERRKQQLDEHEALMRDKIESRMESRLSTTFEKDANNFLNKLEDELVHQLAPKTAEASKLFRFDNEEFEQLEEFANKIATLLNKNNEIEQRIQSKRDQFLKKLSSPITKKGDETDRHIRQQTLPYQRISGLSHTSRMSFARSRYSIASGQQEFPLPNFNELIKQKQLQQPKLFSGVSFINEIQEANANNLLRSILAQSLERVLEDSSNTKKAEWLQKHKLDYVNLQIMREEFAKKELVEIARQEANLTTENQPGIMSHQSISIIEKTEQSDLDEEEEDKDDITVQNLVQSTESNQKNRKIEEMEKQINYDILCDLIKPLSFFRSLKRPVIKKLLKKGHYFVAAKDCEIDTSQGDEIYIILSGSVATRKKRKDGCFTFTMNSLYDGYTFGRDNAEVVDTLSENKSKKRQANIKFQPKAILTSFWALESCDLLRVNRKMFSKLMFAEMKEELRKKISILRQTKFFQDIDPYALLILACNVEIITYQYGSILCKQGRLPDTFYILNKGQCNVVVESVMTRNKEVSQFARKCLQKYVNKDMHFGLHSFVKPKDERSIYKTNIADDENEDQEYPNAYMFQLIQEEQPQLQEGSYTDQYSSSRRYAGSKTLKSTKNVLRPVSTPAADAKLKNVKGVLSPMTHVSLLDRGSKSYESEVIEDYGGKQYLEKKIFGYRQQIQINQLNEGAEFGSRALVDKESIKSYIFYHASDYGIDYEQLLMKTSSAREAASKKEESQKASPYRSKTLTGCNQKELDRVYREMMISQVSIVANSSNIEVVSINKKSLDYLNDEIKVRQKTKTQNYIKRVVFEKNFKDEDRPYPDDGHVRTLEKRQRTWVDYKLKLTEGFMREHSRKKKLDGKDQ